MNRDHSFDQPQGHKLGSLSGPALNIISSNIEGLTGAKQDLLAEICVQNCCDILCIQETHRGPSRIRPRIPGMSLIVERPHDQYGSAIFVRNSLSVEKSSLSESNNIEILSIQLMGISVSSVYKPPSVRCDLPEFLAADGIHVVIGDFNSHSVTWGYGETNEDGDYVESWTDANQLSLIHDAKLPSSFNSSRWRRGYNPDLVFVSNSIASQSEKVVHDPIPRTQHRPIGVKINAIVMPQSVPFRRRFNLKKANWEKFAEDLDCSVKESASSPKQL